MFRKGERRDDKNDERVDGGGGARRMDVKRIGLSRFDDTYIISLCSDGCGLEGSPLIPL